MVVRSWYTVLILLVNYISSQDDKISNNYVDVTEGIILTLTVGKVLQQQWDRVENDNDKEEDNYLESIYKHLLNNKRLVYI